METWYYDTNIYCYNLKYRERFVYDIWDFEIR